MSAWGDYRSAVGAAAQGAGGAVAKAFNAVAEPVSDFVETIGHGVQDGLENIAHALGGVPGAGPVLRWIVRWPGAAIAGVLNLVGASVKAALGALGGVLGGLVHFVGGMLTLGGSLVGRGLGDIVSSVLAAVLLVAGKAVALVQSLLFIQTIERGLTTAERAILKHVFRGSVAFYNVRLVIGRSGVFGLNARPFTLGSTIYMKDFDPAQTPETLAHESTHVWQYQHVGGRYATDALGAQFFVADAYNWEKEITRGNTDWPRFNKEAQAQLIEDVFTDGTLTAAGATTRGNGVFFEADGTKAVGSFMYNSVDRTDLANSAVGIVRGAWCARLSGLWS